MQYILVPRRISLLIFDKDPSNYTASCQININGNKGTIDTLIGSDFYRFILVHGYKPFKDLGLTQVGAAVTLPHLRLMRRYLKDILDINEEGGLFSIGKADLIWINLTEKKPPQ